MVSLVIVGKNNEMKQLVRDGAENPVTPMDSPTKSSYPSTALVNMVHKDPQTKSPKTMVVEQTATVVDSPIEFPPHLHPQNGFHRPVTSNRHP